jgi:preprotein translocase subunit SecY
MISAFRNVFKIPELRSRILFTLGMVVLVRLGASITLPGVNPDVLQAWVAERQADAQSGAAAIASLLNVFSGGGLENCAIFALGIMPYISASIMMQLLTAVVPSLSKMAREEGGRQKISLYTRYATIALCLFQGYLLARSLSQPGQNIFLQGLDKVIQTHGALVPNDSFGGFIVPAVATIMAGTMLMMWMGEQITERGIGNGTSILICVNIVSALPGALIQVWQTFVGGVNGNAQNAAKLIVLLVLLIAVIAGVIAITQAARRIIIQYAKRVVGRKVFGGQTQYLPLKINYSGVMPIIFAQALLLFPTQILSYALPDERWVRTASDWLMQPYVYYGLSAALIFFFSYFWVATMFQPTQISADLQKSGGYLPGVRPGQPTADYLDFTMSRLTFAGAAFLTALYLLPNLISSQLGISQTAAQFFGGTSLLILVGVVLDVMKQMETHLLKANYDGFLREGKVSRFDRMQGTGDAAKGKTITVMWTVISVLALVGVVYYRLLK